MLFGISIDNMLSLLPDGGIVCFLGGRGNTTKNLTSYLSDEFEGSKQLLSTTVCDTNALPEIIDIASSFFTDTHDTPIRYSSDGELTFKPKKPSLLFMKQINSNMWDEPIIECLTDRRDTVKCVKVFSTSYIETLSLDIRKRTNLWIVTRDCSKVSLKSMFDLILKRYDFEEFMTILDEHRALIIWRKEREYKLYSFSDVCPEKSMDISELVQSVVYPDISEIILNYSYRVM